MKKFFLTSSIVLSIYAAQAQPELNSLYTIEAGQTQKVYIKNVDVSPGDAGANQLYDFSDITFEGSPKESQMLNPAGTPYASYFPTATHAETMDNINFTYYIMNDKEQILLGQHESSYQGTATVVFSDPMTVTKFPLAYNETTSDNYYATYVVGNIPMILSGSVTTTYDGYGTLKTQFGTYNNVARLKTIKIDTSQYYNVTTIYKYTFHSFFVPGYITSLFSIVELSVFMKAEEVGEIEMNYTKSAYLYEPSFISSTKNAYLQDLKLSVSPNPASDFISVDFKDLSTDHYRIKVTGQDGSTVLEDNIFVSEGESYSMNLSELKNGLYFLEVYSSNRKAVKKIVKM